MTPRSTPPRHRPLVLLALGAVAAPVLLSSCATDSSVERPAQAATVPAPTVPPATIEIATTPPTTSPPTTEAPPTVPPTAAPPVISTTTTTTEPALPRNVVVVGLATEPIEAVGTSSGPATAAVQRRLLELGFWLSGDDGTYGLTTRQAVMAFQKYHGLPSHSRVDDATAFALAFTEHRAHGLSEEGHVVEVDKSRQLLFIVKDGLTIWTLNASTGTEIPYETYNKRDPSIIERGSSITPVGTYRIERQRAEGWWDGDLGSIYRPKYFVGGVAVHGSNSIPNRPASHGCVRVSVPAMDMIWATDLVPLHTTVWVHGEIPRA